MDMERFNRRVRNGIPDILDNLPMKKVPTRAERAVVPFSQTNKFVEQILPWATREELATAAERLPIGQHLAHLIAGKKEEGTLHAHDYVIEKDASGATFFYLDSEHQMGKGRVNGRTPPITMGTIRPRIVNLLAVRLVNGADQPEAVFLRYRSELLEQDSDFFMPHGQLKFLKELMETHELPSALRDREAEIVFRADIEPERVLIQGRYATEHDLKGALLDGKVSNPFLKGKLVAYRTIASKFPRYVEEGKFKPVHLQ